MLSENIRKAFLTALTLAWMSVIFGFSADTAEESSGLSMQAARFLAGLFIKDFRTLPPEERDRIAAGMQFFVRKGAHMTEYAVLGILLFLTLTLWGIRHIVRTALSAGILYAALDEYHQTFVPGRSGQIRDVVIDSLGLLFGILLILLWKRGREGFGKS